MGLTPTWNINTSNIWFSQLLCDTTGQKLVGLCSGGINNLQVTTVVGYLYLSSDYGKTWASIGVPLENYIITSIAADSTLTYILIAGNINNTAATQIYRYIDLPDYRTFNWAATALGTWSAISCDSTGKYFVAGQSTVNGSDYHEIFYGYFYDLNSTSYSTTFAISKHQTIQGNPNWDLIKMSSDGLSIFAIANNTGRDGVLYSIDSGSSNIPTFTTIDRSPPWGEYNAISLISYYDGTNNVFIVLDDNQEYHKIAVSNEGINPFQTIRPAPVLDGANFTSISCDSTGQYILLCDTYNDRVHFSPDGGFPIMTLQTTPTDGLPGAWQTSLALISPNHLAGFFSVNNAGLSAFLLSLSVPCFTVGSLILTPDGYKNVEDFKDGDDVLTSDGKVVPVNVYTTTLVTTVETAPYRILANTFEEGVPKNDLCLSPYHAIKIGKDMWQVPVRAAEIYKSKISQYDVGKEITYYHLETPNYMSDHLICDGTVVESYAGDQMINKNKNIYAYQPLLLAYNRMNLSQPIMI